MPAPSKEGFLKAGNRLLLSQGEGNVGKSGMLSCAKESLHIRSKNTSKYAFLIALVKLSGGQFLFVVSLYLS